MKLTYQLLKKIRFSAKKTELCYFFEIDHTLSELEIIKDGIPTYISYPTKVYAKNTFFNLVVNTPILELDSLLIKHINKICNGDLLMEMNLLKLMKINFHDAMQDPFPISIINNIFLPYKKFTNHIEEFYQIVNGRLNELRKLTFIYETEEDIIDENYDITQNESVCIRVIFEIEKITSVNRKMAKGEKFELRKKLAANFGLDIHDEEILKKLKDEDGRYSRMLKSKNNNNWIIMKNLKRFKSM